MMPVAIHYSFIHRKVTYHFENPHRFLTADEALDLGLVDDDELAQMQRKAQELGWEDEHETP